MGTQQITDLSYLHEIAMGDNAIVVETTETFISDTPDAVKTLQEHFVNRDWDKLSRQAHKMKPGLKYMGMERASELILEIERQAESEEIAEDLGDMINELESLALKSLDELSAKIEELKSS